MKPACPHCGSFVLREGAAKCPACRRWVRERPRQPLAAGALFGAALGLMSAGAVAGAAGAWVALGRHLSSPVAPIADAAAPSASHETNAPTTGAASVGGAPSTAPSASAAPDTRPPPPPPRFEIARTLKVDFAPVDAVISADGSSIVVLGDDSAVRALDIADGKLRRKIGVVGRATEVRLLADGKVALLGGAGPFQIVDPATWSVQRLDVGGGPVDLVEVGEPRVLVVASSARRLTRFSDTYKLEGHVTLTRAIAGITVLDGAKRTLGVLEQGRRGVLPAALEVFDPKATPFAGARTTLPFGFEPRRGASHERGDALLVADRGAAQLFEIRGEKPMRAAPIGKTPFGAYRVGERWAVAIDLSGGVVSLDTRADKLEPGPPFVLGGQVSDVSVAPDGRSLLVALGGPARDRGAATVLVGGDPPAVLGRFTTGAGSHTVSFAPSGKSAVVTAYWGRALTVLSAKEPALK